MSFSSTETEKMYTGNGVDSTFEITYPFISPTYVKVQIYDYITDPANPEVVDLDEGIDYFINATTVHLVYPDMDGGGNPILVPEPLPVGNKVRIWRDTIDSRPTDYNTYQFPYPTVNRELDRISMRMQELRREVDRAIKLNALSLEDGETLTGEEILEAIQNLEQLIENIDSGAGLPSGGEIGDFLEKTDEFTAEWKGGSYDGISLLTGAQFTSTGLKDTLDKIIRITYVPPAVSLNMSPPQGIREKGDVVSSVTMNAVTVKKTNPITEVKFYRAGVLVNTQASPAPNGGTESYVDGTDFSDTISFYASATDGTGTTNSNTVTYSFVYPYYHGAEDPAFPSAAMTGLFTKSLIGSTSSVNKSFTAINGNVFYFMYPASYGALTSIKDPNNFETIGDWTLRTENVAMLNGTNQSYRIYEFNNPVVAGTTAYTFTR